MRVVLEHTPNICLTQYTRIVMIGQMLVTEMNGTRGVSSRRRTAQSDRQKRQSSEHSRHHHSMWYTIVHFLGFC